VIDNINVVGGQKTVMTDNQVMPSMSSDCDITHKLYQLVD